jgi:ABC-type multidrug transport system ATPase subunit/ABC-type multidrug transport system permease subunit
MLTYAARLRLDLDQLSSEDAKKKVNQTVLHLLDIMELGWCKDRVISEQATLRGSIAGELRRLSLAIEFISLPPILILHDPTNDLEALVAAKVMECLRKFSDKGHTVISTFPKPSYQVLNQLTQVVLLSQGRSIYAGENKNITNFFCSDPLGFTLKAGVEVSDFLMDIANGVERPTGSRTAPSSEVLQSQFESSQYCEDPNPSPEAKTISVLPIDIVPYYGFFDHSESWRLLKKTGIVIERAFFVKSREFQVLRKSFGASVVLGLFFGYFLWNAGNFGDYCMSMVQIPYPLVTTLAACFFLFVAVLFALQVINVHIICQKLQVFRYERSAKCCPTIGFWLAMILSELPFTVFFGLIFSNISYWMGSLHTGVDNYFFYMGVHVFVSIIGLTSALMLASVTRREIVVRDFFLFCLFMNSMTSGFMFQQPNMEDSIVKISQINPLRWAYQATMVWKFKDYPDGEKFLTTYDFEDFDKDRVFPILMNFIIFDAFIIFLSLIPLPNTLKRTPRPPPQTSVDIETNGEDLRASSRPPAPVKPTIFSREASVTGKTLLHSQPSVSGLEHEEPEIRGPTVFFHNISLQTPDRKSPVGYKNVLHKLTGRFDWGKLSVIIGAEGAGKTSLLQILAGHHLGTSSRSGSVYYNTKPIDLSLAPWQRCAYVDAVDEHFRDLTTKDILTYAMQLRCTDRSALQTVDTNVKRTMELLQLTE